MTIYFRSERNLEHLALQACHERKSNDEKTWPRTHYDDDLKIEMKMVTDDVSDSDYYDVMMMTMTI